MATRDLKHELITWLTNLKDKKILNSLASIKDSEESGDWYDSLTSAQKKSLLRGIEDHRKGRTLTSSEFWQRYEK
ncbi:MAG: hypothetical protein IPQ03_11875 [Bacteroidetes bacterium]|jgi:hypothetical protein|nr:hypothetical protein [Bacteroidota bacterium]MBP6402863.1 hypothetical protein [Bacteroidia bacterium]MBK9525903.1 hypothetical protein [Bacteroidota bacterium]MBK9543180.1 hypothetical protein [Bacteroidota bacterium]MBL0258169.1 hypothetical protein [Bacteroidota bacterium]